MFVDEVVLEVTAGRGGNGMVSYRREKYVEYGGPSGGNGGKGGSVVFVGASGMSTLIDLKYRKHIKGQDGVNGGSKGMHGANAIDTLVNVPLGTVVFLEDGSFLGEIISDKETLVVAEGGKGGRGNISLATGKNPCPEYAEKGDYGVHLKIKLVLKVLADVGLIGYPSVGKSSIITALSRATPKIAPYPFTTLSPHLGVVSHYDNSFVLADLPGLVKGASDGLGLGFQFLRHIERCNVFLHVIDITRENPYQDYLDIRTELEKYNNNLLSHQEIIVINKIDCVNDEIVGELIKKFPSREVIAISAVLNTNLDILVAKAYEALSRVIIPQTKDYGEYIFKEIKDDLKIICNNGVYEVSGAIIEKLFNRTDFNNEEAIKRFTKQLRNIGIDDALRTKGAKNGSLVRIYGYEFEFFD